MLLSCGKNSGTLTPHMVNASFTQVISCISVEDEVSLLSSLFRCFNECMRVVGGPQALPQEVHDGIIQVTKHQLQNIADRRKARASRAVADRDLADEKEDLMLTEEMEDFVLEDMTKMLRTLDPNHSLLVAVSSVRELGLHLDQWESGDEGGGDI